jgi:PleD family two-component response regulator
MTHEQATRIVRRLEKTIARNCQQADRGYAITFSCGIVEYDPGVHHGVEALLADGDALMYQRKKRKT